MRILQGLLLLLGLQRCVCVDMEASIKIAGHHAKANFVRNGTDVDYDIEYEKGIDWNYFDKRGMKGKNFDRYDKRELWSLPAVFGQHDNAIDVCRNKVGKKLQDILDTNTNIPESEYYHRSLVLYSSRPRAYSPRLCATILPKTGIVKSYRAKFIGPVFGTVWLRRAIVDQVKHHDTIGTFVYGDLSTVESIGAESLDLATFPTGSVDDSGLFSARCNGLSGQNNIDALNVMVKNLTLSEGTFGKFSSSFNPARTLALLNGDSIVACATLRLVPSKKVTSLINSEGVKGTFDFTQNSPFEATTSRIALEGLASRAKGYHIQKFPVPQRLSASENPCSSQFVGDYFNPYRVNFNERPTAGSGTADEYGIGDLSGRYETLTSKENATGTFVDWNLPLFGVNSIIGRSMVIHNYDGIGIYGIKDELRLLCATIGYPTTVTTGISVFKIQAYGTMYFRQDSSNPDEDTTIFMELSRQQNKFHSFGNLLHVHVYPVNDDALTGTCASAGGHYNPSGVSLADPYSTECSARDPLRCELGDLSARLNPGSPGIIQVVSMQWTQSGKLFFTDEYLPLSGAFSILGRSVVVYGPDLAAPRSACANITQLQPTVAKTIGSWVGMTDGSASANVTLEQATEFDTTKVTGSFSNLEGLASGYHIHDYTISTSAASGSQCAASSVAGHYNPFDTTVILAPGAGTYDEYEVGDLSNKYGLLDGLASDVIPADTMDTNLPLHTYLSASDRSIVIHKKDQNSRWKCANLMTEPATGSNGYPISATVTFNTAVIGTIKLRQIVYEDGGAGMTSYELDVSPISGKAITSQHNWHIHIEPINDQTQCADALGHYDPYSAIDNRYYETDCKPENPLFCEVGDLSKKQARYDIGGGRRVLHDVDTPMHTNFTVLGRSIVFHVANGRAPRYTCANIVPDDHTYTMAFPTTAFHRYNFTKTVADALGINRLRVVIVHNLDVPVTKNGCSRVMVHIAGGASVDANKLTQLTSGTLTGLNNYAPTAQCVSSDGADVLGQKSGAASRKYSSWTALLAFVVISLLGEHLLVLC